MNVRIGKKELEKIFTEYGPIPHERDGAFFIIEAEEDLLEYMDDFGVDFEAEEDTGPKYIHSKAKMSTMHAKEKKVQSKEPHPFRMFGSKKSKHKF